jgi:putative addiction module antidote
MSGTVKITTLGSSSGIVIPKEVLERLKLEKGDLLYLTETPNGIQLSPYQPDFADKVKAAERVMRKYRDALKRLAE